MVTQFNGLLSYGLAPISKHQYHNEQQLFIRFCHELKLQSLPSSDSTLCIYIAHLHRRGIAAGSISHHLSAIRSMHIDNHYPPPVRSEHMKRAIQAINRIHAHKKKDKQVIGKLVMSPSLTHQLVSLLPFQHNDGSIVIAAMIYTATAGLLRPSELTGGRHIPSRTPLLRDMQQISSGYRLSIPISKTDQLYHGQYAYIGAPWAVHAIRRYLSIHPNMGNDSAHTSLWQWPSGSTIRHQQFQRMCYELLKKLGISRSSFTMMDWRAGGATDLFQRNVPISLIKTLGRWRSDVALHYNRPSTASVLATAARMGSS